jgi:chromatin remodeling complex protein RSC6|uniref:DM2 domain-containing protein n=1 Tax=viral metagenome TaxID=1070528 RepID=A0A6C0BY80_9ZZZZ
MAKSAAKKSDGKVAKPTEKKVVEKVVEKVAAPVVEPVSNEVVVQTSTFDTLLKQLSSVTSLVTSLKSDVKALQKQVAKDMKAAQKSSGKRKQRDPSKGSKAPSGFVKPTLITDELAKFLGKPSGSEMARTEVTKEINRYICEHALKDPTNGRRIMADDKLSVLLRLGKDDELTYFNLQKYMSCHFAKGGQPPAATPGATTV